MISKVRPQEKKVSIQAVINKEKYLESQASGDKRLHSGRNKSRNDLKVRTQEINVSIQAVINQEMISKVRQEN